MGRDPSRIFQKGEVHTISCASCARGIPFIRLCSANLRDAAYMDLPNL